MRIFGSFRITLSILLCRSTCHHLGHNDVPLFAGKSLESGVFLKSFPPPVIRKNIFDRKIWRVSRLQRFFVRGGRERKRKRREFPPSPLMKRFVRGATDARQEEGIRDNFDERERLKLGNERSSGGQPV